MTTTPLPRRRLIGSALVALPARCSRPHRHARSSEIKLGHVGEPGSLFQKSADEFAQARQRQARRQGQGRRLRLEPARRRQGDDPEAQARHARHGAAVDGDELRGRSLRRVRDAVPRQGPRAHGADREGASSGRSSRPRRKRRASRSSPCGRTAYRHITNSKRPIKVPADLQGIKLRVPEGKWRVKMFQAYGANPSPMKFSELFTALQTGVMDGQENPFTQIYSAKLQEVQKYLSLSGHVYTPAYLTVGKTVELAAARRAQDPRGHGEGNAGLSSTRRRRRTTTSCWAS